MRVEQSTDDDAPLRADCGAAPGPAADRFGASGKDSNRRVSGSAAALARRHCDDAFGNRAAMERPERLGAPAVDPIDGLRRYNHASLAEATACRWMINVEELYRQRSHLVEKRAQHVVLAIAWLIMGT